MAAEHNDSDPVPTPPARDRRESRLPGQDPKSIRDEPDALARIAALTAAPSYRLAEKDPDFLEDDAVRGVRLEMDYLKPELALRRAGVRNTIVVFGGSRIVEPAEARRRLTELEQAGRDLSLDERAAAPELSRLGLPLAVEQVPAARVGVAGEQQAAR